MILCALFYIFGFIPLVKVKSSYIFCHLAYRLHAGAVEMVVVLARLDELMLLDVSLHLLSRHHEMVITAVHFVVPLRPRRI